MTQRERANSFLLRRIISMYGTRFVRGRRSCTITMFVSRDRGTLGSTLRKNRKFRVLPGVTDCSHIVTSLTPLHGKTVQFRCKSTMRGKKRVATKWQSSKRSLKNDSVKFIFCRIRTVTYTWIAVVYFSDRFDGSTLALFLFGYKTYTISVFFHFSVLPFHFELQVQFVRFVSCQCLPKFAEENSYVSLLPFTDDSVYHLSFLIYAREESHRAEWAPLIMENLITIERQWNINRIRNHARQQNYFSFNLRSLMELYIGRSCHIMLIHCKWVVIKLIRQR